MKFSQILKNTINKALFIELVLRKIIKKRNNLYETQNVVMLHIGRCGSTVLGDMLNEHTDVCWSGEIFEKKPDRYKGILGNPNALETFITYSINCQKTKFYGFETKYLPHQQLRKELINMHLKDYIALLRRLRFTKFIVLQRENYLRRFISVEVAKQTSTWHTEENTKRATKVKIDVTAFQTKNNSQGLLELFHTIDENYDYVKELLSHDNVLLLSYEKDILGEPQIAYNKVCEFLEIEPQSPQIKYKRTNPFPIKDMVTNFDELESLLKETKYNWMLYD